MIISNDGTIKIEGSKVEVLAETTMILHGVYEILKEREGVESANELNIPRS